MSPANPHSMDCLASKVCFLQVLYARLTRTVLVRVYFAYSYSISTLSSKFNKLYTSIVQNYLIAFIALNSLQERQEKRVTKGSGAIPDRGVMLIHLLVFVISHCKICRRSKSVIMYSCLKDHAARMEGRARRATADRASTSLSDRGAIPGLLDLQV